MDEQNPLQVGEFQRSMKALERSINTRFDYVDGGLETIRDEQRLHAERIAVLEAEKKVERKKNLSLSGVAAIAGIAIVEGVKRYFGY